MAKYACMHSLIHPPIYPLNPQGTACTSNFLGALDEPNIKSHSHPSLQCCWEGLCINHQNSKGAEGVSSRLWDRREREDSGFWLGWSGTFTRGSGLEARTQRKEVDTCQLGGAKKPVHDKGMLG